MKTKRRKMDLRQNTRKVIPGICADARALGVSRMHLWAVLSGRRESDGLVRRYQELKAEDKTDGQNITTNR